MNVLLISLLAGLLAVEDEAAKKDLAKFQGSWTAVSIKYNGQEFAEKLKLKFVFKNNQISIEGDDEVKKEYPKVTLKIDPSTKPPCLDILVLAGVQKDAAMEGIYELKGDELRICVKVLGKERPGEFASPDGSSIALLVLKRDK
jgi:uncharacterized protein (TIGR03067 family)